MARKSHKVEDIHLRLICEQQDVDSSISVPLGKLDSSSEPVWFNYQIRLHGKLIGPPKFKWQTGTIILDSNSYLLKATKKIEGVGHVETKGEALRARVFWPEEGFSGLVALVAANRIAEARLTITPVKYRSANVWGCSINTRTNEESEKELDFWNGPSND